MHTAVSHSTAYLVMHKPPGLRVGGRKTNRYAGPDTSYSRAVVLPRAEYTRAVVAYLVGTSTGMRDMRPLISEQIIQQSTKEQKRYRSVPQYNDPLHSVLMYKNSLNFGTEIYPERYVAIFLSRDIYTQCQPGSARIAFLQPKRYQVQYS